MNKRWKPSVTVAAIIEREGRYLLIEEHTPEGLRLNNPAGHLDAGESPEEGCAREALEEQKVSERCFMGLTLRADAKQTANVKRDIAQFIEMMNEKYAVEDSTRVYQLNLQYFEHTTETSPQERLQ